MTAVKRYAPSDGMVDHATLERVYPENLFVTWDDYLVLATEVVQLRLKNEVRNSEHTKWAQAHAEHRLLVSNIYERLQKIHGWSESNDMSFEDELFSGLGIMELHVAQMEWRVAELEAKLNEWENNKLDRE